jgi:hypothetical protein
VQTIGFFFVGFEDCRNTHDQQLLERIEPKLVLLHATAGNNLLQSPRAFVVLSTGHFVQPAACCLVLRRPSVARFRGALGFGPLPCAALVLSALFCRWFAAAICWFGGAQRDALPGANLRIVLASILVKLAAFAGLGATAPATFECLASVFFVAAELVF